MLIKTLTLHSLTYLVGITSSVAVHQNALWNPAGNRGDVRQVVLRATKGDRLPIKPARPHAPARPPTIVEPDFKIRDACKPPIDVRGRCFASVASTSRTA